MLLDALADRTRSDPTPAAMWLVMVALTAAYPIADQVRFAQRRMELARSEGAGVALLEIAHASLRRSGQTSVDLEVLTGQVLVDVHFSARNDLNTGIQRVVRSTLPQWSERPGMVPVAWGPSGALRRLTAWETRRVMEWHGPVGHDPEPTAHRQVVVAPWCSVVVLPEVPAARACPPLACLAEQSGSRVTAIGYDCIPVVSADLMPPAEPSRFVQYLAVVKHADRVSAISESAAVEFGGFAQMMPSQGLPGPRVSVCTLPADVPAPARASTAMPSHRPTILVVGSHEPRKNHLAVLDAAQWLWRDGLDFAVRFIGGSSWASGEFDRAVRALRRGGHDIAVQRGVGDVALWDAYRAARFTVFPSLHEGYGLPVAESLAVGTPAVTSCYGSTAEIARDGGVLMVDPRDDAQLRDAMRRLLVDDVLLKRLRREALDRPQRTWTDYADDLWSQLVAGARPTRPPTGQHR